MCLKKCVACDVIRFSYCNCGETSPGLCSAHMEQKVGSDIACKYFIKLSQGKGRPPLKIENKETICKYVNSLD